MTRHTDFPTIDLEHVTGGTKHLVEPKPDASPDAADGRWRKPSGVAKPKDWLILL